MANISCKVLGSNSGSFFWKKDDEVLLPNQAYQVVSQSSESILTISQFSVLQAGNYTCTSDINAAGNLSSRSIKLQLACK